MAIGGELLSTHLLGGSVVSGSLTAVFALREKSALGTTVKERALTAAACDDFLLKFTDIIVRFWFFDGQY